MAKLLQQLEALSKIREMVAKHFPGAEFWYVENALMDFLDLNDHQEWEFDEDKQVYVVLERPYCKVCNYIGSGGALIEVPLAHGSFHICKKCQKEISSAGVLASKEN